MARHFCVLCASRGKIGEIRIIGVKLANFLSIVQIRVNIVHCSIHTVTAEGI